MISEYSAQGVLVLLGQEGCDVPHRENRFAQMLSLGMDGYLFNPTHDFSINESTIYRNKHINRCVKML